MEGALYLHHFHFQLACLLKDRGAARENNGMSSKRALRRLDTEIDETRIAPRSGGVYQLSGAGRSGKSMRVYAEAWLPMMAGISAIL